MTAKRFTLIIDSEWWIVEDNSIKSNKYRNDLDGDDAYRGLKEGELTEKEVVDLLNEQYETIGQLKKENNKLHQKIFEMRTNIALERTEISRQTYTGKKNEKEYLDAKEFLDEIEKW